MGDKKTWADVADKARRTVELLKQSQLNGFDPLLVEAIEELEIVGAVADEKTRGES